jgi:trehalose 6-phosphate phosphatase
MTDSVFPGMSNIAERIRKAPHLLLGLDYDGTLTPIVDDPAQALLSAGMRQLLESLNRRRDVTLAVISGRGHLDLHLLANIPGLIFASNHGMEIHAPGIIFVEPDAEAASARLRELCNELEKNLRHIAGVVVEDKHLTLSVHHRHVAPLDIEAVWHVVHDTVANVAHRFRVTSGHKVYEIRPAVPWHKGTALAWIKDRLAEPDALIIYVGDDATDEDAFRALTADAVTIKVGDSAETAARFVLPDPAMVERFLRWVHELRAPQ